LQKLLKKINKKKAMEQKKSKILTLSLSKHSNIISFIDGTCVRKDISRVCKLFRKASAVRCFSHTVGNLFVCQPNDVNYFKKETTDKLRKSLAKFESDPNLIEEMIAEALNLIFQKHAPSSKGESVKVKDELYLNQKADFDVKIFGKFLAKNAYIKKVYLGGSFIGHEEGEFEQLCTGLGENRGLSEFYFSDNCVQINEKLPQFLADAVAKNRTLKVLDLSQNALGQHAGSLEIFCEGLLRNKGLEWLNLGNMGIGQYLDELKFLAEMLEKHPKLKILNLGRNTELFLHEANARAFSEGLKNAKKLEQLTVNNCDLGKRDLDLEILKDGILGNKSITLLNLNANLIGGDFWGDAKSFVPILADIIRGTTSIKEIRFNENNIDDTPENFETLSKAINASKSIIHYACLHNNKLAYNAKFAELVNKINLENGSV
jgi:hypothetical protein